MHGLRCMPALQVLCGDVCLDRQVVVEVQGKQISFEILAVLEFNSDRKRMSVLCRLPDGQSVSALTSQLRLFKAMLLACPALPTMPCPAHSALALPSLPCNPPNPTWGSQLQPREE